MKKLIIVALMFNSFNGLSQNDSKKTVDQFFSLYKDSSDEALDFLFKTNEWLSASKGQIDGVKLKLKSAVEQMGEYHGTDLITSKTVGDRLILYTYLVRYDRQPLRFNLLFYKPDEQWRLQNFSYDDKIQEELEIAATADRLKENFEY